MGGEDKGLAIGVDQRMALAALHLLARVITARPSTFTGFHGLAVDDARRGRGLPADALVIL